MTSCERLSDRMPEVIARDPWTPDEARHLASCAECAAEWRVVSAAGRIGADLPALDPARISRRVLSRLATEPVAEAVVVRPIGSRRAARVGQWVAGLAAAAILVLAVRTWTRPAPEQPTTVVASEAVLSELDELSSAELETVLGDLDGDAVEPAAAVSGLNDLSPDELEKVLRAWES